MNLNKLGILIMGTFFLVEAIYSLFTGNISGIGIVPDGRFASFQEEPLEFLFVILIDFYVGFLSVKYALKSKN